MFSCILQVVSEPLCPGTINCKRQTAGKMDLTASPIPLPLFLSPYIVWSLDRALQSNAIPARSRNPADQTPLHRLLYDNYSWFTHPWVFFAIHDINACSF